MSFFFRMVIQNYNHMSKRGKEVKTNNHSNYTISYGTVDNHNVKSVFINLSTWALPKEKGDLDYSTIISKLNKKIKQELYDTVSLKYTDLFHENRIIFDLDMRESGVKYGKKSFLSCEVTLFKRTTQEPIKINDDSTVDTLNKISEKICDVLNTSKHFKFSKRKN